MKNKTSGRRTIQHRHTCGETMADKGETREGRHTITGHMWGDNGKQKGIKKVTQDVGKADRSTRVWRQWETMGDNGRQWETMGDNVRQWETMGDNWFNGRQGETRGDKTLGRRTHHPIRADKGRQDLGKAKHIIQNMQAHMWGDNWRQKGKTRRRGGGHTIQHRHTCGETMGNIGRQGIDKTSRRQTHHPTQAHMWRDNGGQVETGGKADTPTNKKETRRETRPSEKGNKKGYNGRQEETRPSAKQTIQQGETKKGHNGRPDPGEGGHTIQQRESRRGTRATRPSERQTHHPTKGTRRGTMDNGRQRETRPSERRTHHPTKGIKKGYSTIADKGRQDRRKGGHTIQQEETMGDKGRPDPWEGGHTRCAIADQGRQAIQQRETRRGTRGDKGRQDAREGGHTIQHQGGDLKKALRTPNSLLGEKVNCASGANLR